VDEPAAVLLVPPPAAGAELVSSNQLRLVLHETSRQNQ
jgi:hypothetical protein